ncbi:MAG: hypothetical protein IJ809_02240 [Clostridia bacterium]|nr:hypothetical protein [Clostridia bacterium]
MEKRIFSYTEEEIKKINQILSNIENTDSEPDMSSIDSNADSFDGVLDVFIRGGRKILSNPKEREMFHRIYTGVRNV